MKALYFEPGEPAEIMEADDFEEILGGPVDYFWPFKDEMICAVVLADREGLQPNRAFEECGVLRNRGEVPQYYVEGDHEAIIAPELFDRVQDEIARRKRGKSGGGSVFSGIIFCGECGKAFGPKVWHSTDKYRRVIWQCNGKSENRCQTPHLSEEEIMEGFKKALAAILPNRAATLRNLKSIQKRIEDTSELDAEIQKLTDKLDALSVLIQQDIEKNSHVAQDQKEYTIRHKQLTDQFQSVADEISRKRSEISDKKARSRTISGFIKGLSSASDGMAFDPALWGLMVDRVTVFQNKGMDFTLADGETVRVWLTPV